VRRNLFWLSHEQWRRIEPRLPTGVRGVERVDDRRVTSGIVHRKVGSRVKLYSRPGNAWHFERDPIPYALETDWPEPLHFGIRSAAVDHGLRLSSGMRSGTTNFN
jgi:hypothetical protein